MAKTTLQSVVSAFFLHCILPVSLKKDLARPCRPRSEPRACSDALLVHVPKRGKVFVTSHGRSYGHGGHPNTKIAAARRILRVYLSG